MPLFLSLRKLTLVIDLFWSVIVKMCNICTNRLSIKCFIHNALGCLECYECRDFTRYGETLQFLKNASPDNFGKNHCTKWDLNDKKEKNELYSLAPMAILKFKTENVCFNNLISQSMVDV